MARRPDFAYLQAEDAMAKRERPDHPESSDAEKNRFSARAARYARVGANVGGVAARYAGRRLVGATPDRAGEASALTAALGNLKGPLMKVAQLMATIPDLLPPEYATELQKLQSEAPPMGWAFVKRRMQAELGPGWQHKFSSFERHPSAAASLGQVHRAVSLGGERLACKLQYPDMQSAVEADLKQLQWLLALRRRLDRAIDTSEIGHEIGARVREELDYRREAKHVALYRMMLDGVDSVRVPRVHPELSTGRLITLDWLDGTRMLAHKDDPLGVRNVLAAAMFTAWWFPFSRFGIIHGDPHLGNYTVFARDGTPAGINLLDYGCIRIFPPKFVGGVVDLYHGLLHGDYDKVVHAYETWGFRRMSRELIDILNIWARFIYAPLLDDRVRTIADGVAPGEYGRREAFRVHQALKEKGPVTVPREFVFMDRAAIGLGAVFLHLRAELNFYKLFNEAIERFTLEGVSQQQAKVLRAVGLDQGAS
jgi:predicted unusual protein kinase regulating ubiquinone biosynthesis (AarF/ABC1/UbiB family)